MEEKHYYVYLLTNSNRNVLYTGVTNNIIRRIYEHKNQLLSGFTKKYNLHCLVYFETHIEIVIAIQREKQIKRWSRKKKKALIEQLNPRWDDLYNQLLG